MNADRVVLFCDIELAERVERVEAHLIDPGLVLVDGKTPGL